MINRNKKIIIQKPIKNKYVFNLKKYKKKINKYKNKIIYMKKNNKNQNKLLKI